MGFAIDVQEDDNRKVIRYTRYPLFMWCLLIGLCIGFVGEQWLHAASWFIAAPLFAVAMAVAIPCWKYNGEINRAMRQGGVKVTGSKWSFSNPLTIEILKNTSSR